MFSNAAQLHTQNCWEVGAFPLKLKKHYQFLMSRYAIFLPSVLFFTHSSQHRRQDLFPTIDLEGEMTCEMKPFSLHFLLFGNHPVGVLGITLQMWLHLVSFIWPVTRRGSEAFTAGCLGLGWCVNGRSDTYRPECHTKLREKI